MNFVSFSFLSSSYFSCLILFDAVKEKETERIPTFLSDLEV